MPVTHPLRVPSNGHGNSMARVIDCDWKRESNPGIMVSPETMIRRFAALAGIILILAVVTALVWTVHQHKMKTVLPDDATDVISIHVSQPPNEETL